MKHRVKLLPLCALICCPVLHAADGLNAPDSRVLWPQWQARITVSTAVLAPVRLADTSQESARYSFQATAWLGDYYFDTPGLRWPTGLGGLRATSGLLSLPRPPLLGVVDTLPYLGLGYSGQSLKGRWGFTADLGLAWENPAQAARLGRALLGTQGMESAVREIRLSSVLQVGVRYAF